MTIGNRIKQRRLELNLGVDELAEKLGKNRATVYRYESNDIENFPITLVPALAKVLETTPAYLMGWEEEYEFRSTPENSIGKINVEDLKRVYDISDFRKNRLENSIIDNLGKLNNDGKKSLLDYSNVLLGNPDFVNEEVTDNSHLEVAAAHERTDIEVTEEMRKHDDDIMDDDNF